MKKFVITLVILFLLVSGMTIFISLHMINSSKNNIVDKIDDDYDAILVLGCKINGDNPSMMLERRLLKGMEIYKKTGFKILLSGDNGTNRYNEIKVMGKYMLDNNIPKEDIFADYAGFNTYDSLYRAKYIFNVKKVIIVTQRYHMYRALYIADKLDIEAVGIVADDVPYKTIMLKNEIREVLSRVKNYFKVIIKPKSKYLGEEIDLSQEGNLILD